MVLPGNNPIPAIIAEMGAFLGPAILGRTRELYASRAKQLCLQFRAAAVDVPYGPDARHRLNIYHGPGPRPRPMLLFVPGGGFTGGGKSEHSIFYANVGACFAARGFLVAAMNYRLAPVHCWPAGSEDVLAALLWLRSNGLAIGGDPDRIVVLAQSAGATHVMEFLCHPTFAHRIPALRAVALLSGLYRLTEAAPAGALAYFRNRNTPIGDIDARLQAHETKPPLMLAAAEFDPSFLSEQANVVSARLRDAGWGTGSVCRFTGHNHYSPVHALGIQADEVEAALVTFFMNHT